MTDTPPDPLAALDAEDWAAIENSLSACANDPREPERYVLWYHAVLDKVRALRAAGVTLDARPSDDEALRAAAQRMAGYWSANGSVLPAHLQDIVAALAAPVSPSPDVPVIDCLCGDRFTTTEDMAEHLWMAHGHEVPPVSPSPDMKRLEQLRDAWRHLVAHALDEDFHCADIANIGELIAAPSPDTKETP